MPKTLNVSCRVLIPLRRYLNGTLILIESPSKVVNFHLGAPETYNDARTRLTTQDYTQVAARGRVTLGFDSDTMTSNYIDAAFANRI